MFCAFFPFLFSHVAVPSRKWRWLKKSPKKRILKLMGVLYGHGFVLAFLVLVTFVPLVIMFRHMASFIVDFPAPGTEGGDGDLVINQGVHKLYSGALRAGMSLSCGER